MYLRTGNAQYLTWASQWANYFKTYYLDDIGPSSSEAGNYLYDHMYGWGLVLWGVNRNDSAALTVAESILAKATAFHAGHTPGGAVAYYGQRAYARHLLLAAYVAQATGSAASIALRDKLVSMYLSASDYISSSNSSIVQGGMYYISREQMMYEPGKGGGTSAYDAGRRVQYSYQTAIIAEALWRVYLSTGRADVRARIVELARYFQYYAHQPTHVNPFANSYFGHNADGSVYHGNGDGTANLASCDCSYDTACVNVLVMGYKLTGDSALLNRAKIHLRQGTHYSAGSPSEGGGARLAPDNVVHHFLDTLADPSQARFDYNKGELQYAYLLFENGGNPSVIP